MKLKELFLVATEKYRRTKPMKTLIGNIGAAIGVIGMSAMDSESLIVPVVMTLAGFGALVWSVSDEDWREE